MPNSDLDIPFLPIRRFRAAINSSGSHVRNQLDAGVIDAIKDGKILKIRQTPREFLESCPAYRPGARTMPPGPGRAPRRRVAEEQPSP